MRALVTISALLIAAGAAADTDDLASALRSGDVELGIRYRLEFVDQDGFSNDASASTARLRLAYKSGKWRNWSAAVEFDHVFDVLLSDFNSGGGTSPSKSAYPVVADPDGSDLNQLYFDFSSNPAWKWRIGRQRILLDKQRFVGGVGWRQNEQTYDAVSVTNTSLKDTTVFYSYVAKVRRIFGQSVQAGRHDVDAHLLNAKVELGPNISVSPYVYYIDNSDVPAFSTSTIGARFNGRTKIGDAKIDLLAEYAAQSDAANAPTDNSSDYMHVAATWLLPSGLAFAVGFESLGGDSTPGGAFRTPLATLHAFNGWADKFLATPDAGLEDVYVSAKLKAGSWNLTAVYHDFSAERGSGGFGSEIDLSASRKLSDRYGVLVKGALFSADSATTFTDTTKFWLMLTASY